MMRHEWQQASPSRIDRAHGEKTLILVKCFFAPRPYHLPVENFIFAKNFPVTRTPSAALSAVLAAVPAAAGMR
jgi:hypothetical protein